ncbi:hypothetical protein ACLI1A_11655 [Flavobacterium sp. RHBU_3]|uniref:hypothetical protein n=1 Tax=Flavobacterium sp. RHBU_3 TaxID=3391184 RepID=UPI003985155F
MKSRFFKSFTADKLTVWDGSWSNGAPNARVNVQLKVAYDTSLYGSFNCRNLDIRANLTITAGKRVVVHGTSVLQLSTATFTIDNGEFALLQKSVDVSQVKVTVKKSIPGIQRLDYWIIGSPISGKTVNQISPTTVTGRFYDYAYYTPSDSTGLFFPVAETTALLLTAKGYYVRVPNTISPDNNTTYISPAMTNAAYTAGQVATWNITMQNVTGGGTLNSGVIVHTPVTQYSGTVIGKFYMISNPYTATISLRRFFQVNKHIMPYGLAFNRTNGSNGDTYAICNQLENTHYGYPGAELPPFFGMFVILKDATAPDNKIIFTPDMMLPATNYNHTWIRLKYKQDTVNRPLSTIIYNADTFPQFADFDYIIDGAMRFITSAGVYTSLMKTRGVVSAYYPLRVKTFSTGQYTISLESFGGDFANYDITIRDNELNITTDLKVSAYTFTGAVGLVTDTRFQLKITN